jgi:hypothetical protein
MPTAVLLTPTPVPLTPTPVLSTPISFLSLATVLVTLLVPTVNTIKDNDGYIAQMLLRDVQQTDIKIVAGEIEPAPPTSLGCRKSIKYLKCNRMLVKSIIIIHILPG